MQPTKRFYDRAFAVVPRVLWWHRSKKFIGMGQGRQHRSIFKFGISCLARIARETETWWNFRRRVLNRAELRRGECPGVDVLSFGDSISVNGTRWVSPTHPGVDFLSFGGSISMNGTGLVTRTYEPAFIATFKNVTLIGSEPILVTSDGQTILETALNDRNLLRREYISYHRIGYPDSLSGLLANLLKPQVFHEPMFPLIRLMSRGYYHWHVESLTSLYSYRHYVDTTKLRPKLLVHAARPEWMRSSLALMGVTDDDLVEWTATYGRADTVVLASLNRALLAPDPGALRWVSARMRRNLVKPCSIRLNSNFYISRANAMRKVLNEEDVVCALEKLGFSCYELESLAYGDQVQLFSQASLIVGPHGAGFANALHSERATLFELFGRASRRPHYQNLAYVLGLDYEFMMCDEVENNLVVDVPRLLRRVEAVLEIQSNA